MTFRGIVHSVYWRPGDRPASDRYGRAVLTKFVEADRWALIRAMARSIPSSVDLTDYAAVVHALHRARFVAREFCEPLDEVIADARRLREVEALEELLR